MDKLFNDEDIPAGKDDFDWQEEYREMPEYNNDILNPYMTIKIHFSCEKDYKDFAKLINQNLTSKTKSIWFPKLIKGLFASMRYDDES